MNYYTSKNQRGTLLQNNFLKDILIKLLILAVILSILNIFQPFIRNIFYVASSPATDFLTRLGSSFYNPLSSFFNVASISQENKTLKQEVQNLLLEVSSLRDSLKQNADFSTALSNIEQDEFKIASVKTVGINVSSDLLFIDKGKNQGVFDNMPVISKEKLLYGKVLKSHDNFSEVVLISSKNSTFDVKVLKPPTGELGQPIPTEENIYGVIKGQGSLGVFLDLVSLESEINNGDILVTSGLEGFFPRNLLVGEITNISRSETRPFQTANVKPFFQLKNIENLFVITNYLHDVD